MSPLPASHFNTDAQVPLPELAHPGTCRCALHARRRLGGVLIGSGALAALGLPLACVTNKPIAFTTPLLAALDLAQYFQLVLGGDSLAAKKPDPLPLAHVAQALAVAPAQLLMVGDSKNDVLAARALGLPGAA